MGYSLEVEDGIAPSHPHIVCAGGPNLEGRGWAWHDDPRYQPCYAVAGGVAAPAPVVSAAINGRQASGIDRILSIVELKSYIGGAIWRVFRKPCAVCGANHKEQAIRALRIIRLGHIHPGAIEMLRAANVPEAYLNTPRYQRRYPFPGENQIKGPKEATVQQLRNIPVWRGDKDKTRMAQIAFAVRYASKKGIVLKLQGPKEPEPEQSPVPDKFRIDTTGL